MPPLPTNKGIAGSILHPFPLPLLSEAVTPLFPLRLPLCIVSCPLGYVMAKEDRGMSEGGRENVAGWEGRTAGGRRAAHGVLSVN